MDLSGLGSSPARAGRKTDVVYSPDALDDIADITSELSEQGSSGVVLMGLCSGAYHAVQSARTAGALGVLAINLILPNEDAEAQGAVPAGSPSRPGILARAKAAVRRGARRLPGHHLLGATARRLSDVKSWVVHRTTSAMPPAFILREVARRGARVFVLCGGYEGRLVRQGEAHLLRQLQKTAEFKVVVYPGTDHSLYTRATRNKVLPLLTDEVRLLTAPPRPRPARSGPVRPGRDQARWTDDVGRRSVPPEPPSAMGMAEVAPPATAAPDILGLVLRHVEQRPDSLALRDDVSSFTYHELGERIRAVASGLSALGVAPGDRVALQLGNSADFVLLALGCLWLGAPFVPLEPDGPATRLEGIIADCDPAVVVVRAEDGFASARLGAPTATAAEVVAASSSPVPRAVDPGRDAYLVYTSGTTGRPKGVRVEEQALRWAVCRCVEAVGLDETARGLAVSSFHFDGSYGLLFPVLVAGGSLFVPRREDILFLKRFFQMVLDDEITFTSFSPSYLRLAVSSRQLARLAGCHLRAVALGGEQVVAADVEKLWSVLPEVQIFNRYGPTETVVAVTTYRVTAQDAASGRIPIGAPHRGVDFYLLDEEDRVITGAGEPGELYVGGRQLMRGYWGDEELSASVLRDDVVAGRTVYKTGDLVQRDGRGLYIYRGRLDDVVKRNGVRISLDEVAGALRSAPGVTGAWCALVDLDGSPGIAAFVEAGPEVAVETLYEAAEKQLPATMLPDEVHVVGTLPMTHQGKIDRRRLLARAGRTVWSSAAPTGPT